MLYYARIDEGAGKSREETGESSCVYVRTRVEQSVYPTVVRCFCGLALALVVVVACVVSSTPRGFYSYYERKEEGEGEELFVVFVLEVNFQV